MIDVGGTIPGQAVLGCIGQQTSRPPRSKMINIICFSIVSALVSALTSCFGHEKSGKAISKGTVLVAVEVPGWKGPWRETEAWHHVGRSESLKKLPPSFVDRVWCGTLSKITPSSPSCYGPGALSGY